jgi:hypothetical protein
VALAQAVNKRVLTNVRRWRIKNPEKRFLHHRKSTLRKYGLTIKKYEALVEKADGKCAICQKIPKQSLSVDHCHKTGRVRGLLCRRCNSAIGFLEDNINLVSSALGYLKWAEKISIEKKKAQIFRNSNMRIKD